MKSNKKFWKNFTLLLQIGFKISFECKKGIKINGTLFSRVTKISKNESVFEIFPSNFLYVIPIGGTQSLCNLKPVSAMLFHSITHKIKHFDKF